MLSFGLFSPPSPLPAPRLSLPRCLPTPFPPVFATSTPDAGPAPRNASVCASLIDCSPPKSWPSPVTLTSLYLLYVTGTLRPVSFPLFASLEHGLSRRAAPTGDGLCHLFFCSCGQARARAVRFPCVLSCGSVDSSYLSFFFSLPCTPLVFLCRSDVSVPRLLKSPDFCRLKLTVIAPCLCVCMCLL